MGRAGFTLLEVLLAMTIFSVCMAAIYQSFTISLRAFNRGRDSADAMQTLRFTTGLMVRDLQGVYYNTNHLKAEKRIKQEISRKLGGN